jgi:hypothetical protein
LVFVSNVDQLVSPLHQLLLLLNEDKKEVEIFALALVKEIAPILNTSFLETHFIVYNYCLSQKSKYAVKTLDSLCFYSISFIEIIYLDILNRIEMEMYLLPIIRHFHSNPLASSTAFSSLSSLIFSVDSKWRKAILKVLLYLALKDFTLARNFVDLVTKGELVNNEYLNTIFQKYPYLFGSDRFDSLRISNDNEEHNLIKTIKLVRRKLAKVEDIDMWLFRKLLLTTCPFILKEIFMLHNVDPFFDIIFEEMVKLLEEKRKEWELLLVILSKFPFSCFDKSKKLLDLYSLCKDLELKPHFFNSFICLLKSSDCVDLKNLTALLSSYGGLTGLTFKRNLFELYKISLVGMSLGFYYVSFWILGYLRNSIHSQTMSRWINILYLFCESEALYSNSDLQNSLNIYLSLYMKFQVLDGLSSVYSFKLQKLYMMTKYCYLHTIMHLDQLDARSDYINNNNNNSSNISFIVSSLEKCCSWYQIMRNIKGLNGIDKRLFDFFQLRCNIVVSICKALETNYKTKLSDFGNFGFKVKYLNELKEKDNAKDLFNFLTKYTDESPRIMLFPIRKDREQLHELPHFYSTNNNQDFNF